MVVILTPIVLMVVGIPGYIYICHVVRDSFHQPYHAENTEKNKYPYMV